MRNPYADAPERAPRTDWRDDAACLNYDPELWFSLDHDDKLRAKAICSACPVREACVTYATTRTPRTRDGIWGAFDMTTKYERAIANGETHTHTCKQGHTYIGRGGCDECRRARRRAAAARRRAARTAT